MDVGYVPPPDAANRWFDGAFALPPEVVFIPEAASASHGLRAAALLALAVVLAGMVLPSFIRGEVARNFDGYVSVGFLVTAVLLGAVGVKDAWTWRAVTSPETRYGVFLGPDHAVFRWTGQEPVAIERRRVVGVKTHIRRGQTREDGTRTDVPIRHLLLVDPDVELAIEASAWWTSGGESYADQLEAWAR